MLGHLLAVTAPTALPDLSTIVSAISDAATWFWTQFGDLLNTILGNTLLFWVVAFGIGTSVLFAVVKVVKKFGVKGKRFR